MSKVQRFSKKPEVVVKKRRYQGSWSECDNLAYADLRSKGLATWEIAKALSKPLKDVQARINQEVANETRHYSQADERKNGEPAPLKFDVDPEGLWGRVVSTLGARVRRRDEGFTLDGRPAGLYACVTEANRVLKAAGMDQIRNIPACIV